MITLEFNQIKDQLESFSPESKVWVYYSLSPFESDSEKINTKIKDFTSTWKSHGAEVMGRGFVIAHQIIILVADISKSGVSGCSTDSSVRCIQSIAHDFQLDLFNRTSFFVLENENIEPQLFIDIKSIDVNSKVFNPFFRDLAEFRTDFIQKLSDSKYKRML
jgi:hypothetical protein